MPLALTKTNIVSLLYHIIFGKNQYKLGFLKSVF